jgi:hypothetical protein
LIYAGDDPDGRVEREQPFQPTSRLGNRKWTRYPPL